MDKLLCIKWSVNEGRGYTSPRQDTAENRKGLESWAGELKRAWPHGDFDVVDYPHAQVTYMPGPLARMMSVK